MNPAPLLWRDPKSFLTRAGTATSAAKVAGLALADGEDINALGRLAPEFAEAVASRLERRIAGFAVAG